MQTLALGRVTIIHEPEWTGDATVQWAEGSAVIPGIILFELLTSTADPETAGKQLLDEVISLRRDFEWLRRQAADFRNTLQTDVSTRLAQIEAQLQALEE